MAAPARTADADLVAHGAYVARVGDCVACHTAPGGKPMAGGLALNTPFGAVYSTNITPDEATGIGRYTFAAFERVMRKGVAADGHNLYPAMPYPSYAKITDDDMQALFAYLKHGVQPVRQANRAPGIGWPFNMRWGLALWNALFLDDAPFRFDPAHDAQWNRGAYLTQGPGHCGACHTPRGIAFEEKALSDAGSDGRLYLSGATVESWHAIDLRNLWTVDDLVALLKTGQNQYTSAAGGMTDVIHHSTQYMSDADLKAMAVYLKSLPDGAAGPAAEPAPAAAEPAGLFTSKGGLGYLQFCASCHQTDGRGFASAFPPLGGNPAVLSDNPESLIHVVLTGWKSAQTATYPRVYTMPAFDQLSDQELADILTFVRTGWGGRKDAITASQIGKLRGRIVSAPAGAPDYATPRFASMLDQPNAVQLVRGMRLNMQTKALLPRNVGDSLNCASCHLNGGTVALASPYVGLSAQFPSYASRAGKVISLADRINGCFVRSMNGKALPVDSADMKAMVAYFDWMKNGYHMKDKIPGRGTGKIDDTLRPNLAHGRQVYASQCASCHGANGEGTKRADGSSVYPPLWGDQSFNIGAGMARRYTAAAFVKNNMPIGAHNRFPLAQGGLSDQDAVDVAAYFTTQPRADFPPKIHDWPNGGKPKDSRY
ncbi:c-type cytochrome [Paraburkholderia lycopersici]|uniref:Thiosulfate dehydrogenase n=1 Tax=Paraburkholderia lycopersici TaxID=416944 RepID=A0A1G6PME0_9BURK|nr:c-type cytochrome [Paraburkholderia lycopersici]SDC81432.1 thiosulfate dehydrogenase [Paraburkholderia lycopersici]